ncbi:hypothetical protein DL89DRAFT_180145 [Linderina pennispora]|uniref:Ubiquitin-like protease family profile domain-containing protein n=1 Tax=Linderina pennispora TaxID=61395 RepID=A0A1Y1W4Y1_9FUNG|nr:uncharacterized protein DL89DRAFT_180145 [Linderina pennispora]ORX68589.1 hypothetical protein DL89DRAFT_180145 [Linderina pennispora]
MDEASPRDGAAPEPVVIRFKNSEFKITAAKYKDPSKHPYILILDSLGSKHQTTFKLLREYINSEIESRSPPAAADSSDAAAEPAPERLRVTGRYAMVPLQTNMCDCGVFVLHYVEEFLRDPQTLLALAVNNVSLREWFAPGLMRQKRKGMLDLATDLARAYAEAKQCGENGGAAAGSTIGDLGTTPPLLAEPKQDGAMGTGDSDGSMATALGDAAAAGSAAVSADASAEKSARNGGPAPDDLRDATAAAAKIGAESDDFQ